MTRYICVQCGTQYPDGAAPPPRCAICDEERQYVRWAGQAWTTLDDLARTHTLKFADEGEGITGTGRARRWRSTPR